MTSARPGSEEPTRTRADTPGDPWGGPESTLDEVPGYRIERLLARGGMGAVYVARDEALGRRVVLKTSLLTSPRALGRFKTEAEAMARLSHPNVLGVHEVGLAQGKPYMVLPYVEGESLGERLRRLGPLPPREAAAFVAQAARGLSAAHGAGVLHRDLKPDNLLVSEAGTVLLCDFGLAKDLEAEAKLTQTGQMLGTPAYFPPEQAQGRLDRIGPRSDVYGLGATLYALLTGQPPFVADSVFNLLVAVASGPPVPPSRLTPDLDAHLEAICLRCLEKQADARYPSADALADALDDWLTGERVAISPSRWRWWCVPALGALTLGLALGLYLARDSSPPPHVPSIRRRPLPVSPQPLATTTPSPPAQTTDRASPRRWLETPRVRFAQHRCHGVELEEPGFALVYGDLGVDRVDLSSGKSVAHWKTLELRHARRVGSELYVSGWQMVWRLDLTSPSTPPKQIFKAEFELFALDASEEHLAISDHRVLVVLDRRTGKVVAKHGPLRAAINAVLLHEGSVYAACGESLDTGQTRPDFALRRWNLKTGEKDLELPFRARVLNVAFSPQGTDFGLATNVESVLLFDAKTYKERLTLLSPHLPAEDMRPARTHRGLARHLDFSPDGRFVVTVGSNYGGDPPGRARLWRVSDGTELWSSPLAPAFLRSATFFSQTEIALANDQGIELYDLRGIAELSTR